MKELQASCGCSRWQCELSRKGKVQTAEQTQHGCMAGQRWNSQGMLMVPVSLKGDFQRGDSDCLGALRCGKEWT